jgi:hypothetical protein
MTKTALIAGDALGLTMASMAIMPAVEESIRKTYQKRPGEFDEGVPDRISVARGSRFFTSCGAYLKVLFDGEEVPNCIEFCISGGWARFGNKAGNRVTVHEAETAPRQYGVVDVYWRSPPRQLARIGQ